MFDAGAALAQARPRVVTLESGNFPGLFIRHSNFEVFLTKVESSLDRKDSVFFLRGALNGGRGISFESVNFPGRYLRHKGFRLVLETNDKTFLFAMDASFLPTPGPAGATGFEASNFHGYFIRHKDFMLYVEPNEDSELYRADSGFMVREVDDLLIGTDSNPRSCTILADTHIYEAPDEYSQALATIAKGTLAGSGQRDWEWFHVHARPVDGWVRAKYAECRGAT
jgi:hypothetical protein